LHAPAIAFSSYKSLFERSPEALLAVDRENFHIIAASDCALDLLGCTRENLSVHNLRDILDPRDLKRLLALVESAAAASELDNCAIRNSEGQVHEGDLMVEAQRGQSFILLSIRDATARSRVQEQLRQAQKMEALGMLSGGIAHDFNNLLTIIAGYSQMLIASPQMTVERDRTAAQQILKASNRAAELTSQLLAFSRPQSVQPKIHEINGVVDQTATMLGRLIGEHIELSMNKSPDAGRIHADAGQIQQVLINLAINARDAMPGGGTLQINTSNIELGDDYIGKHVGVKSGSYVMLEISDTGTGMDAATRDRVFEPFFTTKAQGKGTGLGLSTVYGVVKRWGGSVDLYTEPGHGTTFRVYLPRVLEASSEEESEATEGRGGHETILLVEDEEGVRSMVHTTLERRGYRVLEAAGGPEGLEVARAHEGPIGLLVTDIIMPHMSGSELAKLLLLERPSTRVLLISGYAGNVLQRSGALADNMPFLQKPFAPGVLTRRVREILDTVETANRAGHS
jgi:two-component system cell cycle sensor histidine kinase/response regulator CckA